MKMSAMIEGLDTAQWTEVQELVRAEYEFAEGMTRVCATFLASPLSLGLEAHVEMPLMAFTKVVARLAHLGHAAPLRSIATDNGTTVDVFSHHAETRPTAPPWHDMRTAQEIGTVHGIRPHRPMSDEDVALAERVARETAPHPRVLRAVWDRADPRDTGPLG